LAIPGPGTPLSINTIATEFGGTVPHSLNEYYRGGGRVPNIPANSAIPTSGTIAISNFYGSTARSTVTLTISANSYNYNVFTNASASPAYVAGITDVVVNVNSGILVGSTATGTYAMSVPNGFNASDTVRINNSGLIYGCGGGGGTGGLTGAAGSAGGAGGNALFIGRATSINNLSTVAGAGGGGGGGSNVVINTPRPPRTGGPFNTFYGGGGGGGGQGYNGGALGAAGSPGGTAGTAGTPTAVGTGGAGAQSNPGGNGGGLGSPGVAGAAGSYGAGAGGVTGSYVVGNPLVTWIANGTRLGTFS
jgi:hypothetical protein